MSPREGSDIFRNARIATANPNAVLPPGRGYLIRRGQAHLLQVATRTPDDDLEKLAQTIDAVAAQYAEPAVIAVASPVEVSTAA